MTMAVAEWHGGILVQEVQEGQKVQKGSQGSTVFERFRVSSRSGLSLHRNLVSSREPLFP